MEKANQLDAGGQDFKQTALVRLNNCAEALMDLSIIIVNWNSADFLLECIASIQEHTQGIAYEIVVVDNASTNADVGAIRQRYPDLNVIESGENLGFARANNLGFKHSIGEYVLFLNPDTQLTGPAINVMLSEVRALPKAGILGCRLLNTDLSVQLSSIQTFPTILNQVLDTEYLQLRWPRCPLWKIAPLFSTGSRPVEVEVISGACMLVERKLFERVGMFSEEYFMYAEDVDLNYKVKRAGFANYYIGETSVIHHGGRSSSQQKVSYWSTIMKYQAVRQLLRKTRGRAYASLYRAAMACVAVVRLGLLAAASLLRDRVWNRESRQFAIGKWKAVLKWSVGRQSVMLQNR